MLNKKLLKRFLKDYLTSIFAILIFNFKYLPFRQAVRLPVWINLRNWSRFRGKVVIDSPEIHTGMILLGGRHNFHHKKGIFYQNDGTLIFKGKCLIGNGSVVNVRCNGRLEFGNNFGASCSSFFCLKEMTFGNECAVGCDCHFLDSNFHLIKNLATGEQIKASSPVRIGNNNWFGYQSLVMKGTVTPANCIISARSLLNKAYSVPENSILAGSPARLVAEGYSRDPFDDIPPDNDFSGV